VFSAPQAHSRVSNINLDMQWSTTVVYKWLRSSIWGGGATGSDVTGSHRRCFRICCVVLYVLCLLFVSFFFFFFFFITHV
jgi:hypothetical protein